MKESLGKQKFGRFMSNNLSPEFRKHAIYRMDESMRMIRKSVLQLSDEEIWKKPNDSLNSVGNLILHLCGNITQYAISSLGNLPDSRKRDLEFSHSEIIQRDDLLTKLANTVDQAKAQIESVSDQELLRERNVQGFNFSGVGIITHVVEHFSYHTGQIALLTKLRKNIDLGFYDGMDLTVKNE